MLEFDFSVALFFQFGTVESQFVVRASKAVSKVVFVEHPKDDIGEVRLNVDPIISLDENLHGKWNVGRW